MDDFYRGPIKYKETIYGMDIKILSDKNWFLVIGLFPVILIWMVVEIFIVPGFIFKTQNSSPPFLWAGGWTAEFFFILQTITLEHSKIICPYLVFICFLCLQQNLQPQSTANSFGFLRMGGFIYG
jgi:hypothetical protein